LVEATVVTAAVPAYTGAPVPTFDTATGQVAVPAGTPAGAYTIVYRICERLNLLTNCDNANIVVNVAVAPIVAVPDTYGPVRGHIGTLNLGNVLGNDTFNGQAATQGAGITNVTITNIVPATSMP